MSKFREYLETRKENFGDIKSKINDEFKKTFIVKTFINRLNDSEIEENKVDNYFKEYIDNVILKELKQGIDKKTILKELEEDLKDKMSVYSDLTSGDKKLIKNLVLKIEKLI